MALLYVDMLDNENALLCYEKAEKIYLQTKDTLNPQYPVFLLEYGAALAESNNYTKALDLTFKAKNSDKKMYGELSQSYAADLNNLGFIYNRLNRFAETEYFFTEALAIKKQLSHQRIDSYLNSLNNLISFYANIGRDDEAMELSQELEKSMERSDFTDTLKRAVFAHNLGIHYKNWGNFSKSHFYFKEALRYYAAVYGPENSMAAQIYLDMGTTFFVENKWEEVTRCLKKAAELMGKFQQDENINTIGTLCNLAIILKEINNPEQGTKYADKALDLVKKLNVTQQDVLEQAYLTKAQLAADVGRIQESMDYFRKYLDLKYSFLEQTFSYMTESEKLFFLEEFEKEIRNYYSVILNNIKEYPELIKTLLDFRLKTKSLLLNNLSKIKEKIRNQKNPGLEARFDAMCMKRETIAKLMNFNTDEYPQALSEAQKLKVEADQMEKEISLSLSTSLSSEKTIFWKDLQKSLTPGEAAIEIFQSYLIYDNNQGKGTNYTFIILKDKGDPIAVSIDRPENWETQVLLAYRNSIANMKTDASLYARLWQLVSDQVKDCKTLYVSPDGIYNQINLNTLYHAQTSKYLIEETELHVMSSLRMIPDLKNTVEKKPQSAVLIGNPRFDLDLTKVTTSDKNLYASAKRGAFGFVLSELPGTKSEVDNIQKTLNASGILTTVFTEDAATEKQVKKIKSPDILHIASHGFFMEDFKDEQLAGYSKLEKDYYKNPMLRCGLFLSGSNNTYSITNQNSSSINDFEDGMLSAFEAMNLKLDNTQLVVLSACETGLGKVKNGEGVFGLQRAFKLAGAKSIIMSLWAVSDDATKDLMTKFYSIWAKQGNQYNSFREAQLELKKTFPEAVYWGAFVMYDK
jgi:CHAT domain-containing protein